MDANEVLCASNFQFRDTNNASNIYRFLRLARGIATAAIGGIDELKEGDRTAKVDCGGVDRIVEANLSNITVLGRLEPHRIVNDSSGVDVGPTSDGYVGIWLEVMHSVDAR